MNILLVDDEQDILEQAETFLENEDNRLEIESTTSAKQGLNLLENNRYDCIVSNYMMPEMDGLEFLQIVREERNSDIPFILFTGRGREDIAVKALNLGANKYIMKGGAPESQYGVLADAIVEVTKRPQTVKKGIENLQKNHPEVRNEINDIKNKIEEFAQIKHVLEEVPDDPEKFWGVMTFRKDLDELETRLDGFEKRLDDIKTERGFDLEKIGIRATIYGAVISIIIAVVQLILRVVGVF